MYIYIYIYTHTHIYVFIGILGGLRRWGRAAPRPLGGLRGRGRFLLGLLLCEDGEEAPLHILRLAGQPLLNLGPLGRQELDLRLDLLNGGGEVVTTASALLRLLGQGQGRGVRRGQVVLVCVYIYIYK